MEIKSALQILYENRIILEPNLDKNFNINLTRDCYVGTLIHINKAMKEYAAQFIDEAAEQCELHQLYEDYEYVIDREDILKIKEQIK